MKNVNDIISIVIAAMRRDMNILLNGEPGVGKTQIIRDAVTELALRMKYFSAPTLDPWADFVGIPVPSVVETDRGQRNQLEFFRPADIESAEVMFFDELNRSHPKVQNAVMELVQFRTINGTRMPNLRCVVAAINPTDSSAHLHALDHAMVDRFDVHLDVRADPDPKYYANRAGIDLKTAEAVVDWWKNDLTPELRRQVSPRRLEKLALVYSAKLPLDSGIPLGTKVPLSSLKKRLKGGETLPFVLTEKSMVQRQSELIDAIKNSLDVAMAVAERIWAWPALAGQILPVLLSLPDDVQASLLENTEVRAAVTEFSLIGEPVSLRARAYEMIRKVA